MNFLFGSDLAHRDARTDTTIAWSGQKGVVITSFSEEGARAAVEVVKELSGHNCFGCDQYRGLVFAYRPGAAADGHRHPATRRAIQN